MASHAIQTGGAQALPDLSAMLAAIPSLPRPLLSRLTARMIERLDEIDGEADDEATADEGEPDFRHCARGENGPGCLISDSDYGGDDEAN